MRIALGIEYDGQHFYGWQKQATLRTIQGCLEQALSIIADEPIETFCAGRTDAGVHATGQVVHFETNTQRISRAWIKGTNTHLPPSISVLWAQPVDESFHARFSALSRCYRYFIYNAPVRSAILAGKIAWDYQVLDITKMQTASEYLLGEQDFSSFRSSQCESKTAMRNVQKITINRQQDIVIIEIQANAFLHHMVRNIVGVLKKVGAGVQKPAWVLEVLNAKDRRVAAETAPAEGLYLIKVDYPDSYQLQQIDRSLVFW
jgi:tRNA pseudouridine38-40 synthase